MSKIRKVAHVVRRFVPEHWGGIETAIVNLCEQLEKLGVENQIYSPAILSQPGEEKLNQSSLKRFPYTYPWFNLSEEQIKEMDRKGGSPLSFSLLYSLYKEPHLSIIHTHVLLRLGGIVRTIARWRKIPYVVSIHSGYFNVPKNQYERMKKPFQKNWEWGKIFGWFLGSRQTLADADAIICVGKDEYVKMQELYPQKKVVYIPNGIDLSRYQNTHAKLFRNTLKLTENTKYILCVSRIDYQKNQLSLIKAFAKFQTRFPNYHLVLIGPITVDEYAKELHKLVEEKKLENKVHIIPGYDYNDPLLYSAYKGADMFVLPSFTEPFGIVILEAWASQVPVISSNVGGIPGFTHDNQDILLYTSDDSEQLADRMNKLASDSDLRTKLIDNATREVKKYEWSTIAAQTLELYERIAKKKRITHEQY